MGRVRCEELSGALGNVEVAMFELVVGGVVGGWMGVVGGRGR